jgi:hypothetical protein
MPRLIQRYGSVDTLINMDLETEISKFEAWALNQPQDYGEWETDYSDWPSIYIAADITLSKPNLINADIDLLLFALARDNECENIRESLENHPQNGLLLAKVALNHTDPEARWQIAEFLGTQSEIEAVILLREFVKDQDEYVRRRALLALQKQDAQFAEGIARQWINSEHDYSRLCALSVLADCRSEFLSDALDRLEEDNFNHIREKVAKIRQEFG